MDVLLLLALSFFVLSVSLPVWCYVALALLPLVLIFLWRLQARVTHIGLQGNVLYLIEKNKKIAIEFKAGSIKREKMVRICWSILPWRVLVLRPDSFQSYADFQQFKRTIYDLI